MSLFLIVRIYDFSAENFILDNKLDAQPWKRLILSQ